MGYIAKTYTFSNGAVADATQVNANFDDIINGLKNGASMLDMSSAHFGHLSTDSFDLSTTDVTGVGIRATGTLTGNGNFNLASGTASFRDATVASGLKLTAGSLTANQIAGDSTISGGFNVTGGLTAPTVLGDSTVGGGLKVTNTLTGTGTASLRDATLSSGLRVGGDATVVGGLNAIGLLTTNGAVSVGTTLNTTGDATVGGGLKVTSGLTAPTLLGDSTISGGFKVTNSLTAPTLNGDSTISGGFKVTAGLTAPTILGDSTVGGGLQITASLTAPTLNGDTTCNLGFRSNRESSKTFAVLNGSSSLQGTLTYGGSGGITLTPTSGELLVCEANGSDAYFRSLGIGKTYLTSTSQIWAECYAGSVTIKANSANVGLQSVGGNIVFNSDQYKYDFNNVQNFGTNASAYADLGGYGLIYRNGDNLCITHS